MKKVIGVWVLQFLVVIGIYSQSIWSKTWNSGDTDYTTHIKSSHLVNDTLYYITFNACDVEGQTFNECNTIGMLDAYGNILKEKTYKDLDIVEDLKNPWMIEGGKLIFADGKGEFGTPYLNISIFDRYNLDSITTYSYIISDSIDFNFASGIVSFDNHFVVSGWFRYTGTDIWPDFLVWIDKETLKLDTTIEYPFQKKSVVPEYLFIEEDSLLTVYFAGIGLVKDTLNQLFDSRGFFKVDKNRGIIFNYQDTIDISTNLQYPHSGRLLQNGNMIYKQRYDPSEQPWPITWGSDFDILCINPQGEILWRFNNPGSSYTNALGFKGRKQIYHMSETSDGDILACGRTDWHYNYPTIFEYNPFTDTLPPFPDSLEIYKAPYILKLDGDTGELLWQYSIIEYDDYGNVLPYSFREVHELSDGSLIGTGWSNIRNENGAFIKNQSWAVRLPADGCIEENGMECGFETYLPTSINEPILINMMENRPFVLYPNPSHGIYRIQDNREIKSKIVVDIYQLDGTLIHTTDELNKDINLTNFEGKVFICRIRDNKGKILQTDKLIKW